VSAPALKVLVACEYTGTVREAFLEAGHDAWSCDLLPSLKPSNRHIQDDVRNVLDWGWDLLIAHPPCTRLCNSGVRWIDDPSAMKNPGPDFNEVERELWPTMGLEARRTLMQQKLDEGAALFSDCWNADIPRVAVENPIMHRHAKERIRNYREFSQSIQPWQFGDFETKRTCLWLRGLEPLEPLYKTTREAALALGLRPDAKPVARVHNASPGPERWAERSKFFPGAARAMAEQWGGIVDERIAA